MRALRFLGEKMLDEKFGINSADIDLNTGKLILNKKHSFQLDEIKQQVIELGYKITENN